jgi:hypothetical protein
MNLHQNREWTPFPVAIVFLAILFLLLLTWRPGTRVTTASSTAVSPGGQHTCALTASSGIKCWGRNEEGEVGDGTAVSRTRPVDVPGLTSGVAQVSAGDRHTCALLTNGTAKCWGYNVEGQLGDGTTSDRSSPVSVCASGFRRATGHPVTRTRDPLAPPPATGYHPAFDRRDDPNSSEPWDVIIGDGVINLTDVILSNRQQSPVPHDCS